MGKKILNIAYIDYLNTREELNYFKNLIINANIAVTKNVNLYLISHLATENDISDLQNNVNTVFVIANSSDIETQNIQLGIVPAIFEETIAQSTIEFLSKHIPVLCGNKGGDCELCKSELFTFDTENPNDFEEKLVNFINNPDLLKEYWLNLHELTDEFIKESLLLDAK